MRILLAAWVEWAAAPAGRAEWVPTASDNKDFFYLPSLFMAPLPQGEVPPL